ncbi:uncharacterized protein LOC136025109 isoform X2 [Artemia franciscana]|uniref:Uncharacterized protein n=1 Tax=Artemia franciscana TaxID=6661 RepID=A0AA88IGZ6_ARTSF|nr:hypothetical protein QYM36_007465 [Artemia franciscana]
MSKIRVDKQKVVILGFIVVFSIYEVSYRWNKSQMLFQAETEKFQCVNQLKVAESHSQKLEESYKSLEKQRNEEKESCSTQTTKLKSEFDSMKSLHKKDLESLRQEINSLKLSKDKALKQLIEEKEKYEKEFISLKSDARNAHEEERSLKVQVSSLQAKLQESQQQIKNLEDRLNSADKLLQSKKNPDGPSLVQPDFKKKANLSVKENILQRPGKEPVLKKAAVKSSQDDTIPKPLIFPNIQPPPGVKNSKPNDFMQGKGDSYKDMANQLGLSKNEADEIVPGEIDGREDGPEGGKMKAYLNEGRPDGDQLRDLLPEIDRENKEKDT